jgi:peptide/nickel transport system ATP-binding protein
MRLILSVDKLTASSSGGQTILQDVSFDVMQGEVLAIIGESGSGKTTLALAALGHVRPGVHIQRGTVHLDGLDVLRASEAQLQELRGRKVAYVAQSAASAFNPSFTLGFQTIEAAVVDGTYSRLAANQMAARLFGELGLRHDAMSARYPHQVSGGQLQRCMAAMGLMEQPQLVVFDEPTSALDVTTQVEVLRMLKEIVRARRTASIFVSHDLAVVAQMADRIAVMRRGELIELDTTSNILDAPKNSYTKALVGAFRRWSRAREEDAIARVVSNEDPVLSVSDFTVRFGRMTAVKRMSFDLRKSEILAVIGESGSGKSSLAQAISGMIRPSGGKIELGTRVLSSEIASRTRDERRRIQMVFQSVDTALNPRHTVGVILGRVLDLFFRPSRTEKAKRLAHLLEMVKLPASYISRHPSELSGGEKQRINLARALAADAEIVICDEITSALDTLVTISMVDLIRDLRDKQGMSFIFISHDLSTVATLADRVIVVQEGVIVEQGATADILVRPNHPYTRRLVASVPELRQGWLETVARP